MPTTSGRGAAGGLAAVAVLLAVATFVTGNAALRAVLVAAVVVCVVLAARLGAGAREQRVGPARIPR